jgi:putative Mg2+ transporter-C (MgtC) family protein
MNTPLTTSEIMFRIFAATVAGALVGLERESRGRAAGLRTTILACVASAIAMITSEFLFASAAAGGSTGNWRPDPARLGAGILTGIGFLGAGTILRQANVIRGVTTAATLWFVTVIGLAFGSGLFGVGSVGVLIALGTLFVLPAVERHIASDWYSTLTVTLEVDAPGEQEIGARLRTLGFGIQRFELDYDLVARRKVIAFDLKLKRQNALDLPGKAVADLRSVPGVMQLQWK